MPGRCMIEASNVMNIGNELLDVVVGALGVNMFHSLACLWVLDSNVEQVNGFKIFNCRADNLSNFLG